MNNLHCGCSLPFTSVRRTHLDALADLERDTSSSIMMMEFYLSEEFNPAESEDDLKRLFLSCAEIGWILHVKALIVSEEEDGLISIGVSRKEEEERATGFSALRSRKGD